MRFVLGVLVLVLLSTAAMGEEVTRKAGDTSLNFSFNGLNIADYKYGIGGKRWLTDELAATASLDIYQSDDKGSTTSGIPTDINSGMTWYGVSLGMEKHLTSHHNLSPYLGGELAYSNQRSIATLSSFTNEHYGINAIIGVEYAIIENISLSADYGFGYSFDRRKTNSLGLGIEEKIQRLGGGAGRLMLQFYL